jgi:hypothetical protein
MAFAQMEPFGGTVDDLRAGLGPALTANMHRDQRSAPVSALDFFPWHKGVAPLPPKELTPEEVSEQLRAMLNAKAKPDGN